jgi:hypothetical protein
MNALKSSANVAAATVLTPYLGVTKTNGAICGKITRKYPIALGIALLLKR